MNHVALGDVEVLRTGYLSEADIAAAALEEAEIPFYRRSGNSSGLLLGMGGAGIGPMEEYIIVVPAAVLDDARDVLAGVLAVDYDQSEALGEDVGTTRPKSRMTRIVATIILSMTLVPLAILVLIGLVLLVLK
jgi:hypothetical protein